MTRFLSERLRAEGKDLNIFGGYDELEKLLAEAAERLEYLEYKRLQANTLVAQLRDMNRDLASTMHKTADLLADAVEKVL